MRNKIEAKTLSVNLIPYLLFLVGDWPIILKTCSGVTELLGLNINHFPYVILRFTRASSLAEPSLVSMSVS